MPPPVHAAFVRVLDTRSALDDDDDDDADARRRREPARAGK